MINSPITKISIPIETEREGEKGAWHEGEKYNKSFVINVGCI